MGKVEEKSLESKWDPIGGKPITPVFGRHHSGVAATGDGLWATGGISEFRNQSVTVQDGPALALYFEEVVVYGSFAASYTRPSHGLRITDTDVQVRHHMLTTPLRKSYADPAAYRFHTGLTTRRIFMATVKDTQVKLTDRLSMETVDQILVDSARADAYAVGTVEGCLVFRGFDERARRTDTFRIPSKPGDRLAYAAVNDGCFAAILNGPGGYQLLYKPNVRPTFHQVSVPPSCKVFVTSDSRWFLAGEDGYIRSWIPTNEIRVLGELDLASEELVSLAHDHHGEPHFAIVNRDRLGHRLVPVDR